MAQPNDTPSRNSEPHYLVQEAKIRADSHRQIAIFGVIGLLALAVIVSLFVLTASTTDTANDVLVGMVQWTVGLTLTLGLALVAYQWLGSNRAIERERENIKSEQDHLQRELDAFHSIFTEYKDNVDHKISDTERSYESKASEWSAKTREEALSIANEARDEMRALRVDMRNDQTQIRDAIDRRVKTVQMDVDNMRSQIILLEGQFSNVQTAMTSYVRNQVTSNVLAASWSQNLSTVWGAIISGWSTLSPFDSSSQLKLFLIQALISMKDLQERSHASLDSIEVGIWQKYFEDELHKWVTANLPEESAYVDSIIRQRQIRGNPPTQ